MDKPKTRRLRHSMIWRLFGSVLLCIALLLVFNWLLNNFALVAFYRAEKEDALARAFRQINAGYGDEDRTCELLYDLSNNDNISTMIWNRRGRLYNFRADGGDDRHSVIFIPPPLGYAGGEYVIAEQSDDRLKTEFIQLEGCLDNGDSITMRTPVTAIEESVGVTNRFLLISGGATLLIGVALVLLIARSFTRPISQLSHIAGNVAKLDFSERYAGRGSDELADLGNSINSMSASLERTISDLKTANARLAGDMERASRQNEARRAFIANVSHELKTPIALIQTYAEGLKEDIADGADNRDYYCEVIEDEAQKMSSLIKKLTALMQLEAGGEQLDIERFDIAELARNLMAKNNIRFAQKGVAVIPPPEQPVYVWADAYLIENVLTNFLSNALNHVQDDGRVECRVTPQDNGRVRVSVFNTGSHIPEDDLARVWESFYKVDKARTRAYGGTGIGLSVVAAIMNAHHMPYGVWNRRSPYGDGVEFFIELEAR